MDENYRWLNEPDRSLELSPERFQELVGQAMEKILPFIETLSTQKVRDMEGGLELARSLREPLPTEGASFDQLLEVIFERCLPKGINLPSPGYMGYIPAGGLLHTAVAELISNSINRWPALFDFAPGFVQLEANVIQWLCQMMGLPKVAGGVLTSGGSLANFSAVFTARATRLPEDFLRGTIYCSDQAHHSILKAAVLAGFPRANVRKIPVTESFQICLDKLEAKISEDQRQGFLPFLLVGNAGTTSTGSVDDLQTLAAISKRESLWFHVDAAWAGAYRLTQRGHRLMEGIEEADSITIDPHKALFLPFGSGALLVRDPETLRRAHSVDADYLPLAETEKEKINFCNLSPELSRTLRGLQLWVPLKMHGVEPFRHNFEEKLELTRWAYEELGRVPEIRVLAEPALSVLVFRFHRDGMTDAELDLINEQVMSEVNSHNRVLISGTRVFGQFVLRLCPIAHNTHHEHVALAVDLIRDAMRKFAT